ncbi:hypothetical protein BH11PLA2_BH11PLA2_08910 [soil metagenome]
MKNADNVDPIWFGQIINDVMSNTGKRAESQLRIRRNLRFKDARRQRHEFQPVQFLAQTLENFDCVTGPLLAGIIRDTI